LARCFDLDRQKFKEGMRVKIANLVENELFDIVPRICMPAPIIAIHAIWSLEWKRLPDWTIVC
jgi:hypothetical protein